MAKISIIYFDLHTGYYPSFHQGLAYLIGALRSENHNVNMFHLINEDDYFHVRDFLRRESPDIIGLSFTTNQKKYVAKFFDLVNPHAKLIIAGGVHSTLIKEEIFQEFPDIDGICIGEGEVPLNELCSRLDKNESFISVPSFYFKYNDKIIKNAILPLQDINTLPFPNYALFNYNKIIEDSGQTFPMMLSRGCPYNCSYCCNHVIKEVYPNKANYVRFPSIQRAENIIKSNILLYPKTKNIIFADDTFTLNKKWILEFCEMYKMNIGLPFSCNARVETINDEIVRNLKNAGCISISFGIESGNEWLRNNILNRKHSNETIKHAFSLTRKYGIKSWSSNIVGLPFETMEMARDTVELNLQLRPDFGKCFYFFPYIGSKLHKLCSEYDMILSNNESKSGYMEGPSLKPIFMSKKEIITNYERMQIYFYSRLIFSKIRIPFIIEKILNSIIFIFKKPILALLNQNYENKIIFELRRIIRKIAMSKLK